MHCDNVLKLNAIHFSSDDDNIIAKAKEVLNERYKKGTLISSPDNVRDYLQLKIAELEFEVFGCVFLDARHRIINDEIMFRGSITGVATPCREIVKESLRLNAAALIVYHNHPSGNSEASQGDKSFTNKLSDILKIVEVELLDHFVVSTESTLSFAESGFIF